MTLVTLTTDFGTQDGYVGAMKGVILARAPRAQIVDISHEVPREDVAAAAFALAQAAPHFPRGTIHVVVVDPGVGGVRHGVVVDAGAQLFVGPDNGVFELVAPAPRAAWEITSRRLRRDPVSATFHGRDVFAPAAAALAAGAKPSSAGPEVALQGRLPGGPPGKVIHVDRFGNLVTDLRAATAGLRAVKVAGRVVEWARTYSDVASGALLAYLGSAGTVEVAVRDGSAAALLGVGRGAHVEPLVAI